ncbi:Type VI secretion system baseplate component TssK1 [Rhodovastum atsumiense]|uniref:Type VI secretion system baseplate subunit TssK n=1 Tax=Rhodovastum atsumiense TaxID=504468 RepID=A0A5M6IXM7_9PROT|nr:type VI secretion system baseplate subunit TssK [Rhodovastum atsumiense]KAA5612719.1 type VI secretion system baseplate subunit TssK [Rhodovastum atsumiense]CAH2602727.1 Type VI secretion system baseplate component TssK1 [Rhodovastum atsumiense]
MSWSNRVAWQEGMFLRAQHFQQQDRWVERQIRSSAGVLCPFPWGFASLRVDRDLLGVGRVAVAAASGLFDDGTAFAVPDEAPPPAPLLVPESTRNALVFLAAPLWRPGAPELGEGEDEERYRIEAFDAFDTHSRDSEPAPLQIGRLRLRTLLETDDRSGYACLPFARVVEVMADRRVVLDESWVPPALTCAAAPALATLLVELSGMLGQRAEALAARLTATGLKSNTELADFLLLQAVNGWRALFAHFATSGALHPEALYRVLVQMAGELATFTDSTRRGATYPAYRHEDLQRSFAPVVSDIRRSLSAVLEQTAVRLPLQERRHNVRVAPIPDRTLLGGAGIVLVVRADMPAEALRRNFPATAKIGAVEHIRELVNVALPGIELRALPVAPRQMPFVPGALYFELDRNSPHWQQMQASGGFAIHVSGNFPGLELDLWAIR